MPAEVVCHCVSRDLERPTGKTLVVFQLTGFRVNLDEDVLNDILGSVFFSDLLRNKVDQVAVKFVPVRMQWCSVSVSLKDAKRRLKDL